MSAREPLRVVLTGSESTGKTTLGAQLALHYGVLCVPEFVRGYAERKGAPLDTTDHEPIARGQVVNEEAYRTRAREAGHTLLLHDTDLLSTVTYCHHYYGLCPSFIEELAVERRPAHYLLLDIDVPWVPDGVRDRGDRRHEVQQLFVHTLTRLGAPYTVVSGSWSERFARATTAVDTLLSHLPH